MSVPPVCPHYAYVRTSTADIPHHSPILASYWGVDPSSATKAEPRRPSDRPDLPAQAHPYRTQICDQLGRVAGMFEALGMGDGLDHATHQTPDMRDLTVGEAVNAMGLNGLGGITQARSRVPRFFQNQPPSRLISPRVPPPTAQ